MERVSIFFSNVLSLGSLTLLLVIFWYSFGDTAFSAARPRVWNYIFRQTSDSRTCHTAVLDSR